MGSSRHTAADLETAEQPSLASSTLAKALAPEEVRLDDFVTMLHEIAEVPSFFWWCDDTLTAREELVRIRYLPRDGGTPLKVKSICLPFVLVRYPNGEERPLDLRKCRLARLSKRFATRAWKSCKKLPPIHSCRS